MEATVRIGLVKSSEHGQALCTILDPNTGSVLAMGSIHHFDPVYLEAVVADMLQEVLEVLRHP